MSATDLTAWRLPDAPFPPTPEARVLSPLQTEMPPIFPDGSSQLSPASNTVPHRPELDGSRTATTGDLHGVPHGPVLDGRQGPRGNSIDSATRPPTYRSATLPTPSSSFTLHPRAYSIYAPPGGHTANSSVSRTRPSAARSSTYPDTPRESVPQPSPATNASPEDTYRGPAIYQSPTSHRAAWVYDRAPLTRGRSSTLPASLASRPMAGASSSGPLYHPLRNSPLRHETTGQHEVPYARSATVGRQGSSYQSTHSPTPTASGSAHSPSHGYISRRTLTSSLSSVRSSTALYSQPHQLDEEEPGAHTPSNDPGFEEADELVDVYLAVEARKTALRPATDFVWLITWRVGTNGEQRILRLHWQGLTTGDLGHYFGAYTQNVDDPIVGVDSAVCLRHMQLFLLGRLDRAQREELERIPVSFDVKYQSKALRDNIGWIDALLATAVAKGLFDKFSVHRAMVQGRGLMN